MSMAGWNKPDRYTHVRELILRGLAEGQLKPIVDKVFPLDQVAEAHRYLESNRQVGKVWSNREGGCTALTTLPGLPPSRRKKSTEAASLRRLF